jgi:hypothetical protein
MNLSSNMNIHGVASIEVSEIRKLGDAGTYVRDITFKDVDGNAFEVTVFAEGVDGVKVNVNGTVNLKL